MILHRILTLFFARFCLCVPLNTFILLDLFFCLIFLFLFLHCPVLVCHLQNLRLALLSSSFPLLAPFFLFRARVFFDFLLVHCFLVGLGYKLKKKIFKEIHNARERERERESTRIHFTNFFSLGSFESVFLSLSPPNL